MMRQFGIFTISVIALTSFALAHPTTYPATQQPLTLDVFDSHNNSRISPSLFAELEELARIVDISYCVGTTGITKPFLCASRCDEFPAFELVDTFNTGPFMSDSCGYIVIDHGKERNGRAKSPRLIVAFRGTYSIANTIVDLSTIPQEYVPYPDSPPNSTSLREAPSPDTRSQRRRVLDWVWPGFLRSEDVEDEPKPKPTCRNCTVHTGFWTSWKNTRPLVLPPLEYLRERYPDYEVHLVGHSLGGAVAALAGLEFDGRGWNPYVTTFGEPRVGNSGLRDWIDATFALPSEHDVGGEKVALRAGRYRRLTHVDDPVPLLPLQEWGYRAHAGEVYIGKATLQPTLADIRLCYGDEDVDCMAGAEIDEQWFEPLFHESEDSLNGQVSAVELDSEEPASPVDELAIIQKRWGVPIPARYKIWQLFFAHRDYFWRLGLCVPGGDPIDWARVRYGFGDGDGEGKSQDEIRRSS